jgi:bleomycin hydrolase
VSLQVFRVVSVCLGSPPETISWEYRDKDKAFNRMGPLTPQQFYKEHVKPLYNMQDKVQAQEETSAPRAGPL